MSKTVESHDNPDRKTSSKSAEAGRVVLVYAIVALVWIFASDRLVALWSTDTGRMAIFSSLKGTAFVVVTSLLLLILIRRLLARIEVANQRLREAELREEAQREQLERERRLDGIGKIAAEVASDVAQVLEPIRLAIDRAAASGGRMDPQELVRLRGLLSRGTALTSGMVGFGAGWEPLDPSSPGRAGTRSAQLQRSRDLDEADLLVLEEESVIRVFVQEWLETFGYRVATAASEAEVRSMLHSGRSIPRSVVVDWSLGGSSPESVLSMLRGRHPNLIAVGMSGQRVEQKERDRLGVQFVLPKPFSGKDLLEAMRKAGVPSPQGRTEGFQRGFLDDMSTE